MQWMEPSSARLQTLTNLAAVSQAGAGKQSTLTWQLYHCFYSLDNDLHPSIRLPDSCALASTRSWTLLLACVNAGGCERRSNAIPIHHPYVRLPGQGVTGNADGGVASPHGMNVRIRVGLIATGKSTARCGGGGQYRPAWSIALVTSAACTSPRSMRRLRGLAANLHGGGAFLH